MGKIFYRINLMYLGIKKKLEDRFVRFLFKI